MATFTERVKALGMPLDHLIVIGSGLLDAYGLRPANDIDLVVTDELYTSLQQSGQFTEERLHGEKVLQSTGVEVWRGWLKDQTFMTLAETAVTIDNVQFVHPDILLENKRIRGTEKDRRDVALLEEYLHGQK